MEVALRPRINAPDVVRSALGPREKISENTIDNLFGAPNKIFIPERYIPEQAPELSPEEKKRRQEKVEAIKKMLSDTTPTLSGNVSVLSLALIALNIEFSRAPFTGHCTSAESDQRREEAARASPPT
jgi:hypothetical protein